MNPPQGPRWSWKGLCFSSFLLAAGIFLTCFGPGGFLYDPGVRPLAGPETPFDLRKEVCRFTRATIGEDAYRLGLASASTGVVGLFVSPYLAAAFDRDPRSVVRWIIVWMILAFGLFLLLGGGSRGDFGSWILRIGHSGTDLHETMVGLRPLGVFT
jgi:hypothetical protein